MIIIKQTPMQEVLVAMVNKTPDDFRDWFEKNNIRLLYEEKYAIVDAYDDGLKQQWLKPFVSGKLYFRKFFVDSIDIEYYYDKQSK